MFSALRELPNNKVTRLSNTTCVYCGVSGKQDNPLTKEHVIGRRFVPKGSLASGWALIVNACRSCNGEKADLEDDISAITLQPDLGREHENVVVSALARNKAKKARSRRTKKLVGDSDEHLALQGELAAGVNIRVGMIAPPQHVQERIRRLAQMHTQAFFYLITYDEDQQQGGFIPGRMAFLTDARRTDWGNPLLRGFAEFTATWQPRVVGTGAKGFFRIAIRRDSCGAELWSFALEWNAAHRIVGFFGDCEKAQLYVDTWPRVQMKQVSPTVRYREEVPLAPEDDVMFLASEMKTYI
jgi:hypothetical protein